jgi:Gpi18-like mannosyltransferase
MRLCRYQMADQKIRDFIIRYGKEILFFLLVAVSILIRVMLTPYTDMSPDYDTFVSSWMQYFRQYGIAAGLAQTIPGDDYYIPMNLLYAIAAQLPFPFYVTASAISCIDEYISVLFLYKILTYMDSSEKNILTGGSAFNIRAAFCAAAVLYIPAAVLNGSYWKQCDAVYSCFLIISLYCLIQERYAAGVIWFSVSFCFKMQAVFFLPFLFLVWAVRRKFNFLLFLWFPAVYLISGLPAVFFHRGIKATYLIYYNQMQETVSYKDYGMNSYFPNIYAFGLDNFARELQTPAVLIAGMIVLCSIVFFIMYRKNIDRVRMLLICCWMVDTCCVFLPGMHERYDYLYLLLITVYSLFFRHRLIPVAMVSVFCSLITYTMVFQIRGTMELICSLPAVAVFYLAAYAFLTYDTICQVRAGKTEEPHT